MRTAQAIIIILALAAGALQAQPAAAVKSAVILPDIKETGTPSIKMKIALGPGRACTTDVIPIGPYGKYSVSYWDSVRQGSDKDTTILQFKLQGANVNVASAFSSFGMTDSFAFQDTNINHNAGWYCPRVYDMSGYLPYWNHLRGILTNLGPDSLKGFSIYQKCGTEF